VAGPSVVYANLERRRIAMKKFLVLYMASADAFAEMMKNTTPQQQQESMDAWMKWMEANKSSFIDDGAPLGKTKRVDATGVSDTRNEIGGYSIVQAESADAAAKLFGKEQPHLQVPGAWIEIVEIMPMPGM
jgi:hypothetical protein